MVIWTVCAVGDTRGSRDSVIYLSKQRHWHLQRLMLVGMYRVPCNPGWLSTWTSEFVYRCLQSWIYFGSHHNLNQFVSNLTPQTYHLSSWLPIPLSSSHSSFHPCCYCPALWPQLPAGLLGSGFMALAWRARLLVFLISRSPLTRQANIDLEKTLSSFCDLYTRNKLPLCQRYLEISPLPAGPSPVRINSFTSL